MAQEREQPTKKPYTTPTLTAYGDVRKITKGSGSANNFDNGSFGNKTTP
jgi:hypothetical protein